MIVLAWVCLGCAVVPAALYFRNVFLFREPPVLASGGREPPESFLPRGAHAPRSPGISVLIPARNEELGIAACLESVLASRGVDLEVIVLDDHSTDRTAGIVREMAAKDSRLRLEPAPPLPDGWCGKQAACFALSKLATRDVLAFLDADVRLAPDALDRMALFLGRSGAGLVSGFPRQETGTLLEKLLIPLIHWLLLCWLPLGSMRRLRWSVFGAGCGQWFMTTRAAYDAAGGHAAVRASLHDGLTLPRAYRRAGFHTDLCDATDLATCRMYRSAGAVWFGLAKNAREGMAATGQIGFWTVVLLCGQVLPFALLAAVDVVAGVAVLLVYAPRLHAAWRFRQSPLGAVLHPVGVLLLLAVQWYAVLCAVLGKPAGWKGRPHPRLSSVSSPRST
ncbi:glycosyltransferase family 2 protein [Gemmata sp.]|uniref:glycosyltransferase family 2 protein n=1 Tax=Gemmata sp. TaxID=1914242 RepID=UPI003F719A86